jgi:hypothetical protein
MGGIPVLRASEVAKRARAALLRPPSGSRMARWSGLRPAQLDRLEEEVGGRLLLAGGGARNA